MRTDGCFWRSAAQQQFWGCCRLSVARNRASGETSFSPSHRYRSKIFFRLWGAGLDEVSEDICNGAVRRNGRRPPLLHVVSSARGHAATRRRAGGVGSWPRAGGRRLTGAPARRRSKSPASVSSEPLHPCTPAPTARQLTRLSTAAQHSQPCLERATSPEPLALSSLHSLPPPLARRAAAGRLLLMAAVPSSSSLSVESPWVLPAISCAVAVTAFLAALPIATSSKLESSDVIAYPNYFLSSIDNYPPGACQPTALRAALFRS